jgi:hypothetical protein
MPKSSFKWTKSPVMFASELNRRVAAIPPALAALAATHAARAEAAMKAGAAWNDITAFARGSLYGRSERFTIILGTVNSEYGPYLELGTVKMAARPIIQPTLDATAVAYFNDAAKLIKGILGG